MHKIIQQNDHIILPKATLRCFEDKKDNRIAYLDLNNPNKLIVKYRSPNSFHSKNNYYNPEYDCCVQGFETLIGNWRKKIDIAFKSGDSQSLDLERAKKDIIDLITIQFHRTVIADDELLAKYRKQQQWRNNSVDVELLEKGQLDINRINYSTNFRDKANTLEEFRFYAQNILGTKNEEISKTYLKFAPCILHIPDEVEIKFLLMPQYFVANDAFARFILSPKFALALYPYHEGFQKIVHLSKEDAICMEGRAIESALCLTKYYRQIVGLKSQLESLAKSLVYIFRILLLTSIMIWSLKTTTILQLKTLKMPLSLSLLFY